MKPTFFILGAAKCGTTSLYHYLMQHPEIFFSKESKEPGYFCFYDTPYIKVNNDLPDLWLNTYNNLNKYLELFKNVTRSQIGDATPEYLLYPERFTKKISEIYADAKDNLKFIVLLRNPVDRIWSHYSMMVRDGYESLPFEIAIKQETIDDRLQNGWHVSYDYLSYGTYGAQLKYYFDHFDRDNFLILLSDDLLKNPSAECNKVFKFLNIDETFKLKTQTNYNISGVLKNRALHNLLFVKKSYLKSLVRILIPYTYLQNVKCFIIRLNTRKKNIPEKFRSNLQKYYESDIKLLMKITNLDFSEWLKN